MLIFENLTYPLSALKSPSWLGSFFCHLNMVSKMLLKNTFESIRWLSHLSRNFWISLGWIWASSKRMFLLLNLTNSPRISKAVCKFWSSWASIVRMSRSKYFSLNELWIRLRLTAWWIAGKMGLHLVQRIQYRRLASNEDLRYWYWMSMHE